MSGTTGPLVAIRWFKVYAKNCRTREVRQVDMTEVFTAQYVTRYDILSHVNHWNRLSAENEDCLWLYWVE